MHIRLHLVRFMFINLILSCGFWVYDNVAAAADAKNGNSATATENGAAGLALPQLDAVAPQSNEAPNVPEQILPNYKKLKKVATTTPPTRHAEDNGALEFGTPPVNSAQTLKQNAVKDTSVVSETLNTLPLQTHNVNSKRNDDNNDISVVPNSKNNNEAAEVKEAEVQVPNNKIFSDNLDVNTKQTAQLEQTPKLDGDDSTSTTATLELRPQATQSFPEIITELPTATVAELPDHVKHRMDAIILDNTQQAADEQQQQQRNKSEEHQQQQLFENGKAAAQKDEQVLNINDPGGGLSLENATVEANATSIENETATVEDSGSSLGNDTAASNLTAEEVPMPVFSEWAQKQMEAEASREQAMELEQQVVNSSTQRRNTTGNGNGKAPTLKLRAKNYASPDCGAKIIASNGDASNTGAVLSHSSDEYMLSTCGNRIWFVVELCEAIQAQKVDLANFELFSSSPKNFTVAVSKRFPTRDWSNVGRFVAEDKRTVQTFELHPHLFGKFVRVDIHSHYSKEHFCPVSLFRVFGTSEFEAFETEIRPSDELDDFYDDFGATEQAHKAAGNIFQSASDAVMQMVKKAAEVLVKPSKALRNSGALVCSTPTIGSYQCASCNSTLVERINSLLSCQFQQLQMLLALPQLRMDLLQTRICRQEFELSAALEAMQASSSRTKGQSYYLSVLPPEYVGAMCKLLEAEYKATLNASGHKVTEQPAATATAAEQLQQKPKHNVLPEDVQNETAMEAATSGTAAVEETPTATAPLEPTASMPTVEVVPEAVPPVELDTESMPATKSMPTPTPTSAEVNIFNVPPVETDGVELPAGSGATALPPVEEAPMPAVVVQDNTKTETGPSTATTTTAGATGEAVVPTAGGDLTTAFEDNNAGNWESIDNLLGTTVASITAGGGAAAAAAAVVNGNGNVAGGTVAGAGAGAGVNLQQKLTNGAQSESVFIRLSNRIKALERNMSLSGQYLEELSRRYKKQVEELQQTLTQQTLTVRTLEDQSRRYIEQEQLFQQQSAELAGEVRALTYQVQACILVIIIVGTCIFLMLVLGTVYYRKLRRQTQHLKPQADVAVAAGKHKLVRRKSFEEILEHVLGKQRRPSEEVMLILKESGDLAPIDLREPSGARQRKVSVCYGSNNNITGNMLNASARASLHKRKGAKHSWHSSLEASEMSGVEQLDKFFDVDTLKSNGKAKASRKKSQQALKRQESAPCSFNEGNGSQITATSAAAPAAEDEPTQSDFDESLMLDDDDLANFIPTSDLAYNEFMPEGPSGYQIVDAAVGKHVKEQPQPTKKSRRLSSPAFFKSAFSKSKIKSSSSVNGNALAKLKNSHSAHEPTSWEWYRLRRSEKQQKQQKGNGNGAAVSPNASLDSSSLSEINFPLSSTQNSFRILGEAIMSSAESGPNGANGNAVAGGSSSSGGSTTSSTTKKKQRAFNNIFRKVF